MRVSIATMVCLSIAGVAAGDPARAAIKQFTNIPAQELGSALQTLAQELNVQFVYLSEGVDKVKTPGAVGELTPDEALTKLLKGTGLSYRYLDEKTVTVEPVNASTPGSMGVGPVASLKRTDGATSVSGDSEAGGAADQNSDKDLWTRFRLNSDSRKSQLNSPFSQLRLAQQSNSQAAGSESSANLAEVIVTAQKREESLLTVPVPVTVLSGEVLTQSNQLRLQDYYQKIPGLSLTMTGDSVTPSLSIRGIANYSSAIATPTVGVVIDDVPYGSATGLGGRGQPDIDPGDVSRIEVLRGPQGTLYGANSMGGLLKFVTIDPSTEALSGRIQTGVTSLFNGVDPGYNVRGSVNIPVNETIAVRASAFRNVDGGYIENIQTDKRGVNRQTSDGGRLSALWKPSDVLSLKLSALIQDSKLDGPSQATTGAGYGDLQTIAAPSTWTNDEKTQAYSAVLKASFGGAELTSLTGYNIDKIHFLDDFTPALGGIYSFLSNIFTQTPGSFEPASIDTRRVSEELRLSVPISDHLTWLIGGFYAHEKNELINDNTGGDPATGAVGVSWLHIENRLKYEEYAAFTNVSYDFTDKLNLQVGGRFSTNKQTFDSVRSGAAAAGFFPGAPVVSGVTAKDSPFTFLVTPQYKFSPELMAYARIASGYRPGGPNIACNPTVPCKYDAEKTENYELGLKGDLLDHVFTVDASVYYIDWKDIITVLTGVNNSGINVSYNANLGTAKSQGVELSMAARPIQGLTLSAWVAWDDAKYTGHLPASVGPGRPRAGDRFPYSPRFSGNFSADEEFIVSGPLTAFVGASVSYVGNREDIFQAPGTPRGVFPAYAQTDIHGGLKHGTWTFAAFVNNVTDKRGILSGGGLYPNDTTYKYIHPRIFGLNASKTFK